MLVLVVGGCDSCAVMHKMLRHEAEQCLTAPGADLYTLLSQVVLPLRRLTKRHTVAVMDGAALAAKATEPAVADASLCASQHHPSPLVGHLQML